MFWKRKKRNINMNIDAILIPLIQPQKQLATMFEILHDAEKYCIKGEKEVSDALLTQLCKHIENYKTIQF